MEDNATIPTVRERILAAAAHAMVLLPFAGIAGSITIWATQKDKSDYVCFQALQAVAYQIVGLLSWLLGMSCCYASSFLISIASVMLNMRVLSLTIDNPENLLYTILHTGTSTIPGFLAFILIGITIVTALFLFFYALVAAAMTFQGQPFVYLLIGKRIERYLDNS